MRRSGLIAVAMTVLTVCMSMAGCSSSGKPAPAAHIVEMTQMTFSPAEITVHKGDTVIFVNNDIVTHNITENSGKSWASPLLQQGNRWSLVVDKGAGYYCALHPVMKGTIVVQ